MKDDWVAEDMRGHLRTIRPIDLNMDWYFREFDHLIDISAPMEIRLQTKFWFWEDWMDWLGK